MTRTQALRMAKANKARKERSGILRASPFVTRVHSDGRIEVWRKFARDTPLVAPLRHYVITDQDRMRANLQTFAHREGWLL